MTLGTSSTAAKLNGGLPESTVAMPNAPPWLASTLNSLTNSPDLLNSTISLGWVASALTASPLAVRRFPSGANTSPKGPQVPTRKDRGASDYGRYRFPGIWHRKDFVVGCRGHIENVGGPVLGKPRRAEYHRSGVGLNGISHRHSSFPPHAHGGT